MIHETLGNENKDGFNHMSVSQCVSFLAGKHMNNNPEEVGTLGHLLVTANLNSGYDSIMDEALLR